MRQGDKVMLGPLIQSDGPFLFKWMNDPVITASNGAWRPTDGMDFANWFQAVGKDPGRITFAVRRLGETRPCGYLSIMAIHAVFRSAEMGVTIGAPEERGQGLGRDAMRLGLGYCWDALALERVTLRIYGDNQAAIRCYQGAGFAVEGVLRQAAFLGGRRVDITLMGALKGG
ncbi:MAG: GNAT family N-acetyltransferase [Magnetospirillum sp.]|nr:GNAT family N-acetyltransferase [Magnetospirillum sp.]